jgi:transmembrane sensor
MNEREIILLKKFINNTCSHEDLAQVDQILKAGVAEEVWLQLMDEFAQLEERTPLAQHHINKLYASIEERISHSKPGGKQISLFSNPKRMIGIAASLLLIAFASTLFFIVKEKSSTSIVLMKLAKEQQRKQVGVSDGSQIWINSQSSLEYPEQFKDDLREVKLEGEAFFEVAKEAARPFVVHTQNVSVKVLGTSFNVKSYNEDDDIIITLATGKVQVEVEGHQEFLTPGEQLVYYKRNKTFKRLRVDPASTYAWREGWLVFNSAQLVDITKTMERTYGVKISIEGETLKQTNVTLKLKDENINNVLEVLSFSAGFHYEITDFIVNIKPKK